MRALMIFIVLCAHSMMDGQSITDVRYWFDQNEAETVTQSTDGSPWQDAVDVSALSEGWHVVHFAFKDDLGQWSSVESNRFRKRNSLANEITAVSYWFDEDDATPITSPVSGNTWTDDLDISALSLGWHRIYFYFHDARGNRSSVVTDHQFRKYPTTDNELVLVEYWFDEDSASPGSSAISGLETTYSEDISTSDLSTGWHVVHLRFKDERGNASSVISNRTHIIDGEENTLLLAKFWFDDCDADDQFVYEYQSPDPEIVFFTCTCLAPCDPVVGDHQMHVQFQDVRGVWSSVLSETLFFNDTPCASDCRADVNGDGIVDILDFIQLNSAYGTTCTDCPEDINDDGSVDVQDFIVFNSSFGKICDYAFEGQEVIGNPTKDLKEELASRPDIVIHEDLRKVIFADAAALINAYPNPNTEGELYVRLSELKDVYMTDVQMIDATGRVIYHESYNLSGSEALLKIELPEDIAQGSYTLRLLMNDGYLTTGIMIE